MSEKYTLKIDLNSLNHLGLNLYSNVSAVLSELVANSWDADAFNVNIEVNIAKNKKEESTIIVKDDGCGMDVDDLNKKFLTVGYQRRKDAKTNLTSTKKRQVMGRKGIGKLSVFSIAECIEVFTIKINNEIIGLELDVAKIKEAIETGKEYNPTPIKPIPTDFKIKGNQGTIIVLKKLKKRIVSSLEKNIKKENSTPF